MRQPVVRLLAALLIPALPLLAQDLPQRPFPADSRYFDFWEGTWYAVRNGVPDTTGTRFVVRPGPHRAVWIEEWR